jgi:hypothetical protein
MEGIGRADIRSVEIGEAKEIPAQIDEEGGIPFESTMRYAHWGAYNPSRDPELLHNVSIMNVISILLLGGRE